MKLVRNQYPFDVTMRRGLRGGAHAYMPVDGEEVKPKSKMLTPEAETRKFVQGIPSLYSRSPQKQAAVADAGFEAPKGLVPTAERLLQAAEQRAAVMPPVPALAPAPSQAPPQHHHQESPLQARLRAMVTLFACLRAPCACVAVKCEVLNYALQCVEHGMRVQGVAC